MCECQECIKCLTINILNKVLTIIVLLMNGIYAVWGLFIPRSTGKESWKEYANKLETYLDVVSYSDSVLIPLKAVTMIITKWCCCKSQPKKNDDDPIDKYCSRGGGEITFQMSDV